MGKYLLFYKGGSQPQSEEESKAVTDSWIAWFTTLGEAVVDPGNPFGPSKSITSDGTVGSDVSGGTGYSVLSASNLDDAIEKSKSCPQLAAGGTVEVYETFEVM